jgi:hypothetical protein
LLISLNLFKTLVNELFGFFGWVFQLFLKFTIFEGNFLDKVVFKEVLFKLDLRLDQVNVDKIKPLRNSFWDFHFFFYLLPKTEYFLLCFQAYLIRIWFKLVDEL